MIICTVIGHVWATKKEESLNGLKLMIVRDESSDPSGRNRPTLVAADIVGAGIGERVLVVSGSTARLATSAGDAPVDAAIIGIIDSVEVDKIETQK